MLGNDTIVIPFGFLNLTKLANNSCRITNISRHGKPMSEGFLAFVAVYYVIVIVLGVIGNGLIIAAFLKGPKLRRVTVNVIMVHMAVVNLIHVCISNPFALIKNYNPDLIENRTVNCTLAISFWMCFTISLYSLVAISINRFLLIARPSTTFRRFCTGRAVGLVLLAIWVFAFTLHFSLWLQLMLSSRNRARHKHIGECEHHKHRITSMELITIYSLVIFVPPLIIVPIMHSLTLYTMRSSTRRVQRASEAVVLNRQLQGKRDQSKTPSGSLLDVTRPIASTSASGLHTKSEVDFLATTFILANHSLRAAAIVVTPPGGSSSNDLDCDTGNAKRTKSRWSLFRVCRDDVNELDSAQGSRRPRLGRQRGELRLIRLMLSVYSILIVTWIPTLIMMTDVFDLTELHIHGMLRLGLLYPLFPSLVPYVYLWSNRNFQRTIRRFLRRHSSARIYKPAQTEKPE